MWGLTCVVLLACAAIFLCQSRGALIGTGCGFIFVTVALARASDLSGQVWVTMLILVAGTALVLCLAPDAYLNRLETLQSADSYADRLQIVKDLTTEFKQFPLVGAGLGSHEYVYPMYDRARPIWPPKRTPKMNTPRCSKRPALLESACSSGFWAS